MNLNRRVRSAVFAFAAALAATVAHAEELPPGAKVLACGENFRDFQVLLDPSGYTAGSGFYRAVNARVIYNYAAANDLRCVGYKADDLACVGFWFEMPDLIAKVRVKRESDGTIHARTTVQPYRNHKLDMLCELRDP